MPSPSRTKRTQSESQPYGTSPKKEDSSIPPWTEEEDTILLELMKDLIRKELWLKAKDLPVFKAKFEGDGKHASTRLKKRVELLMKKPLTK